MLDSKLASKQHLETTIEDDRHEIKELEDIVSSCTSQKESCESDLYKTEAALDMVKKEVADKNYEVFLVTTQPNFRWGGLITFISVLMVLLIVSMGVTRFEDVFRRGVKKVLGLPKRIRRAPTSARREYYMFPVNAPLIEASKQFRLSKEYLFSLLYLVRSLLRTSR